MQNFKKIKNFENFKRYGERILSETLRELLSADIDIIYNPLSRLQTTYGINIEEKPFRDSYKISNLEHILICHCSKWYQENYIMAIVIKLKYVINNKIFHRLSQSVSNALEDSSITQFRNSIILMNENLIERVISKTWHFGYNPYIIYNLIDKFNAIRSTTFEGKYLNTGLILTNSFFEYKNGNGNNRSGTLLKLKQQPYQYPTDCIDNRFWKMADGKSSFYIASDKKPISYMFFYDTTDKDYVDCMVLKGALHRNDLLFRTFQGRELSIINGANQEFIYQQNVWHYRDHDAFKHLLKNTIGENTSEAVLNSLIKYILILSKNDTSSILWIPIEEVREDRIKSSVSFSDDDINICNKGQESLIMSLMTSDGAVQIDRQGKIIKYACIAVMEDVETNKAKGTGEQAAKNLARNGIAIKISQDGTIKLFLNPEDDPIKY